jgi:hypothetical protein
MDSLPVELLRLIFEYCDASTVQHLRLVSKTLATVGYEYLIPAHFTSLGWRDDVKRLHAISNHDQLKSSIEAITFNLASVRKVSIQDELVLRDWLLLLDPRNTPYQRGENGLIAGVDTYCHGAETRPIDLPSFSSRGKMVEEALKNLPRLKTLVVTQKLPYDMAFLRDDLGLPTCSKSDRVQACKNMNVIVAAVRHTRLSSLTIDQLPLELFKVSEDRRHWFDCARSFSSLSHLDIVIDVPPLFPQALFRAINGLGRVLELSPNLTHLSLGFQNLRNPAAKFALRFDDLLGDFTFRKLSDLKLEGISCSEKGLRTLLLRHAATLERLRLGGRGMAKPYERSVGGIHLYEGSWRSFFSSLHGKLPRLERFHMEGDCEAGELRTAPREVYRFHAVTDDNWEMVDLPLSLSEKSVDSLGLERYLLHGGEYPKLAVA